MVKMRERTLGNMKIKKCLTVLALYDKIYGRMEVGLFFMPKNR